MKKSNSCLKDIKKTRIVIELATINEKKDVLTLWQGLRLAHLLNLGKLAGLSRIKLFETSPSLLGKIFEQFIICLPLIWLLHPENKNYLLTYAYANYVFDICRVA